LARDFPSWCRSIGFQVDLLLQVGLHLPRAWKRRGLIAEQLYLSGIKVLHVVLLVGFFMGMIVSLQTGIELSRIGQQDQIGTIVGISMAREMGPFITGIILAATVGSALAAEIGTMSVSEELAALEVLSVDRTDFLVLPRMTALAVMCPLLTVLADLIGILGGGFVAQAQLNVGLSLYLDSAVEALQTPGRVIPLPKDVYAGLFKAFVFGVIVATISCSSGLRARGGALGVGGATRQAVRDSIIAIIVSNYFMTWLFYQA
jgi:phospholipid/cholesterol/gamma-HCH transport system permease protein